MVTPPEILLASRFFLRLELTVSGGDAIADAVFLECQGFQKTQNAIEVVEVTPNQWGKASRGQVVTTKIPGNVKTDNLILRRGLNKSMSLWNWYKAVEDGQWAQQVAEGSLSIYDQAGSERARYNFQRAWPMRYSAADLNAQSTDIEIEELELAVESLVRSL